MTDTVILWIQLVSLSVVGIGLLGLLLMYLFGRL